MALTIHDYDENNIAWELCVKHMMSRSHDFEAMRKLRNWIDQTRLEYDKYMDKQELAIFDLYIRWSLEQQGY